MSDARDVEKRWHDPAALRQGVEYGIGVIVVAGIAFAVFAVVDKGRSCWLSVPAILFLGGVGALVGLPGLAREGHMADLAGCRVVPADPHAGVPVNPLVSGYVRERIALTSALHFDFA